ncbi:hypothetical protein CC78DRAFT_551199 [Lojkania enalia]|uniref:Chitin-binding type-4 domain-containing protein n=1 Tax=Lojkania enalia TaxID=147567 RepID=A0A9P4KI68_9PLEO|nr:hypothetical protein CC78DRAFT_551199 [Didymosphaeria enalia]
MQSTYYAISAFAGLVSTVAGHGYVVSPAPRMPGDAMVKACGQQVFNNQNSDHYGNVQGELQVANGQSDFDAATCNVWQCKGFQFEDNTANVKSFSVGEVVPMTVEIRAPHTGTANVSVVKTSSNSILGDALISWDVYASNSAPITEDQTSFEITIPEAASECTTAGDCVIQWYWDARSIDQTYEACIDFTVGSSGDNTPLPASSAPASSSSSIATTTASPVVEATSTPSTPTTTSTPETPAAPTPSQDDSSITACDGTGLGFGTAVAIPSNPNSYAKMSKARSLFRGLT